MIKTLASALLLTFVAFSTIGQKKVSSNIKPDNFKEHVRIGVLVSLTGSTASYGVSSLNAIKLASEEINAAGGIGGRRVELIVEDDHSNAQEVASLVTKLITQDKVHALVGESVSTRAMIAAPIAQSNHVVMISPASIKPEVTMQGDYVFRACFTSRAEGSSVAEFAVKKLKARRAAIILDDKNDYAVVLANFFREHFNELGGEIVSQVSYAASDTDLSRQVGAIKSAKPDVIFAPGFYNTASVVAREVRQQNLNAILIGSDGWDSPNLLESGGAALHGVYFANHFWVNSENNLVRKFVADYKARYGVAPDSLAATGYDAARMLFAAIRHARSLDRTAIRNALAQTVNFPGVTGTITLNSERNANVPVYMLRIEESGQLSLQ